MVLRSFLLTFLFISTAHATCDVNAVLSSALQPPKPSTWRERHVTAETHPPAYRKYQYLKPYALEAGDGSLVLKDPKASQLLFDLESLQLQPDEFYRQFYEKNKMRLPIRNDYLNFYKTRMALFESGMKDFLDEVVKLDPGRKAMWEQAVKSQQMKVYELFRNAKGESNNFQTAWAAVHNNIVGSIAELQAGLHLSAVESVSLPLKNSTLVTEALTRKLKLIDEEAAVNPDAFDELAVSFPTIMDNPRILRSKTRSEKVNALSEWIKSKEIDIVRKEDGQISWVEVKHNVSQLNDRKFNQVTGKKSYREQILETKEILEFLGLENEIHLEYLATGGMDFSVKKFLQGNGIKVINP